MNRTDVLLKIITAASGEKVTPVQLQKVAFLIGMNFGNSLPGYYQFKKYDYGPFCVDLYHDAEILQRNGLISISVNPRGGWKEYSVTPSGLNENVDDIPEEIASFVEDKVTWARNMSFQGLVRSIYQSYPEYRENSVFQG